HPRTDFQHDRCGSTEPPVEVDRSRREVGDLAAHRGPVAFPGSLLPGGHTSTPVDVTHHGAQWGLLLAGHIPESIGSFRTPRYGRAARRYRPRRPEWV